MQLQESEGQNVDIVEKCWYCKRNLADNKYLNIEEVSRNWLEITGLPKIKHQKTRKYTSKRCKNCFYIHKKVDKIFIATFTISFLCLIIYFLEYWHSYSFEFLVLPIIFFIVFMPIAHILIEIYFAKKYNTKPKCARIC